MTADDVIFAPGPNAIGRNVSPEFLAELRRMPIARIREYRGAALSLVGYSMSVRREGAVTEVTAWWYDADPVTARGRDVLEAQAKAEALLRRQRA